jgi:hypothetical protein
VVIDDLDAISIAIIPRETDAPLVVDPDTMLSFSCSFQCLKSIGWWRSEVLQLLGIVQHPEIPARNRLNLAR